MSEAEFDLGAALVAAESLEEHVRFVARRGLLRAVAMMNRDASPFDPRRVRFSRFVHAIEVLVGPPGVLSARLAAAPQETVREELISRAMNLSWRSEITGDDALLRRMFFGAFDGLTTSLLTSSPDSEWCADDPA